MPDQSNAKDLIRHHEALKLKPYRCFAGKLTIGYGRNLESRGISEAEADFLFESDFNNAQYDAITYFAGFESLDEVRQAVLIDMSFQLGLRRLGTFVKLKQAVKDRDFVQAAVEMVDSQWAKQTPNRARTLAAMMRHGTWS